MGVASPSTFARVTKLVFGIVALGCGVAELMGWPRPFDPVEAWSPVVFLGAGVVLVWAGSIPEQRRARAGFATFLAVVVGLLYFGRIPFMS